MNSSSLLVATRQDASSANILRNALKNLIPKAILGAGVLLLAYMIIVEDEPGAVPLLLIVIGGAWLLIKRFRTRE